MDGFDAEMKLYFYFKTTSESQKYNERKTHLGHLAKGPFGMSFPAYSFPT